MLLKGPNIQLLPFTPNMWEVIAKFFYSSDHKDMWRHHPQVWGKTEFENYPKLLNASVYLIINNETKKPVGLVQMIPDCKTNRGFYVGIMLDKENQEQHITHETFVLLFNIAFNRLGYRKAIVEILKSKEGFKQGLLNAGFLHEGTMFGEAFIDGEFVDEIRLSMSASYFNKHYKEVAQSWEAC